MTKSVVIERLKKMIREIDPWEDGSYNIFVSEWRDVLEAALKELEKTP